MSKPNHARAATLEQIIQREVQERLDHHVRLLKQPFRIAVLGLTSDGPMFVLPVRPDGPDAPDEAVRVIAASVENEMEEKFPGLRLMLRPEFAKARGTRPSSRRNPGAKYARVPSRGKGSS